MNLMEEGLKAQARIVESNKVATLSDRRARKLKEAGKRIVHKPAELEHFNPDQPQPPKAA